MIINYITIEKISDLDQLLDAQVCLSGDLSQELYETYQNGWGIILSHKIIKKITADDLADFFLKLIAIRTQQVSMMKPLEQGILYIWFDEIALQLCFNILSAQHQKLPFGCKVNIIDSPYPIFQQFVRTVAYNELYGNYLGITEIVEDKSQFNDHEIDFETFIIDVWQIQLPWNENE